MAAKRTKTSFETMQGKSTPMGVTIVDDWINFAVAVPNEKECYLNLYYKGTGEKAASILLKEQNKIGNVFAIMVKGLNLKDFSYMYQVKDKEFLDPYAKLLYGRELYAKKLNIEEGKQVRAGFLSTDYTWADKEFSPIPYSQLMIYKLHVRGFTKHATSQVKNKGTFLGITEKIEYLKDLGINCLQLMPAYEYNERIEHKSRGTSDKINYWGYSEDNFFFAPKASYAAKPDNVAQEFKDMVDSLHKHGIEVIMEMNFTSNTNQGLIQDCLRFWALEYRIDGFQLNYEAIPQKLLATDPILSNTKLLSAGWNSGEIYNKDFKPEFINLAEYNNGYSVDVKRFLKAEEEQVGPFSYRMKRLQDKCGTVNYITNHDGFTMMDLYSYDVKHNEANGENNKDGAEYNYSWNCGEEGTSKKKKVAAIRRKQIRNAFAALLLSQGTPLILAGDEFGNSQQGNNNAYCQDNEMSWLNWALLKDNNDIYVFVKELIMLRTRHPILHMNDPLRNMDYISCGFPDISFHGTKAWYPDYSHYSRMLGVMLAGNYAKINRIENDWIFYILYNMHWEKHIFDLPNLPEGKHWHLSIDTTKEVIKEPDQTINNQRQWEVPPRTMMVFTGR